jgi:hypothetical protein
LYKNQAVLENEKAPENRSFFVIPLGLEPRTLPIKIGMLYP